MKLNPVIAGALLALLMLCFLGIGWKLLTPIILPSPLADLLIGLAMWFISIFCGVLYWRRRRRQEQSEYNERIKTQK